MSDLGELLELLHGASRRWHTVRLTVRRWGDSEVSGEAMQRSAEQRRAGGATVVATARGTGNAEPTWEMVTRAWIDRRAERSRIESTDRNPDSLSVRRGRLWWSYTPQSGSISNESEPEVHGVGMQDLDWLLDPSLLLATFEFEPRGRTEMSGRQALEAVAVPRAADPRRGLGGFLARGGDAVVLAVDAERGVVLRSEVRLKNRPFALTEIVEVAFDEAFADDLFEFVSPDGSPIRSPRDTFSPPEPVSIEEAARRASFTVLVPKRLPRGWSVEASYVPASERPRRAESVHVQILGGDSRESRMRLHESAEALPDHLAWQEVEQGGRTVPFLERGGPGGANEAKVVLDGTHIRASGNLDRQAFLDIVASLVPAPRQLPPIVDR